MFNDKVLRAVLFGTQASFTNPNRGRVSTFSIPSAEEGEPNRDYYYRSVDGFVLVLIKKIEKLEERIEELENKKK